MKAINKRGQLGLDVAKAFLLTLFGAVIVGFIVVVVAGTLQNTDVLPTGSYESNLSTSVFQNASGSVSTLFSNTGTWMVMIGIAVLILIIAVVVFAVSRFGNTR